MKNFFLIIALVSLGSSCSALTGSSSGSEGNTGKFFQNSNIQYDLEDKSGKFVLFRERGYQKRKNRFIVKERVYPSNDNKNKLLEESISISNFGNLKGKISVLRPYASRYKVWFEGKLYQTETKINLKEKVLDVKMKSPETQWNGTKRVPFPKGTGVYCFFNQIVECAGVSGFINKAIKNDSGIMNFHIIFEGYPYFQEQYTYLPASVFAKARLEYDGSNKRGEKRFTLKIGNQSIFYFVDKKEQFLKKFWVTQGLSQSPSEIQPKDK